MSNEPAITSLRRQISRDATMRGVQQVRPSSVEGRRHACCQWPLWGDERPRVPLFCSAPVQPGSSFCATHHAIVWEPVTCG
jgi:hypothetical protein